MNTLNPILQAHVETPESLTPATNPMAVAGSTPTKRPSQRAQRAGESFEGWQNRLAAMSASASKRMAKMRAQRRQSIVDAVEQGIAGARDARTNVPWDVANDPAELREYLVKREVASQLASTKPLQPTHDKGAFSEDGSVGRNAFVCAHAIMSQRITRSQQHMIEALTTSFPKGFSTSQGAIKDHVRWFSDSRTVASINADIYRSLPRPKGLEIVSLTAGEWADMVKRFIRPIPLTNLTPHCRVGERKVGTAKRMVPSVASSFDYGKLTYWRFRLQPDEDGIVHPLHGVVTATTRAKCSLTEQAPTVPPCTLYAQYSYGRADGVYSVWPRMAVTHNAAKVATIG